MERGGLSFIKTWGRTSLDEWHEWAKNTQPDNEGDVLIQALLQVQLDFTQHLCSRVFGFMAPHEHYHGPSRLNRAALEILAACAWGEGGHSVSFDAHHDHFNYPTGLQGHSARPNHKSVTSLIWWANRNYAARCSAERECDRLVDLVRF